jgi:hypothetical protein
MHKNRLIACCNYSTYREKRCSTLAEKLQYNIICGMRYLEYCRIFLFLPSTELE